MTQEDDRGTGQAGQVPAAAESAMATAMAATTLGKLLRAALTSQTVLAGAQQIHVRSRAQRAGERPNWVRARPFAPP